MRILATGGAGFICSHVVDGLIAEGHAVAIVDDLSGGAMDNVNRAADFFQADIRDTAALRKVFESWRPDLVNHHAAQVNVRRAVDDPQHDAAVNLLGTVNLLHLSVERKVRKFVFISSGGAVYGEPDALPVSESHPVRPLSPYGASKFCAECYVGMYKRIHGLDHTILRYANVYGPRQSPRGEAGVVAIFAMQMLSGGRPTIFGDGTKTRDYVYVEDLVAANVAALLRPGIPGPFNLGSGIETSDIEVFNAVRDALGVKVEPLFSDFRQGEVNRICLDSSPAREKLGWRATTSFRDGIRRAVEFYRARA